MLFRTLKFLFSNKNMKPIGKDVYGNIYYENVIRYVVSQNGDKVISATVPKENSDWLNYKTNYFPDIENVKKRTVFQSLSSFRHKTTSEQDIYELIVYVNRKVKKSTITYSPSKELTLFSNLEKSFIKF